MCNEKNELRNRNLHISGLLNEEKVDIGDTKVDIENGKVDIQDKKVDIKSVLSEKGVNSNPRIPFVTQDSLFVNENPVL